MSQKTENFNQLRTSVVEIKIKLDELFLKLSEQVDSLVANTIKQEELDADLDNIQQGVVLLDPELEETLDELSENDLDEIPEEFHDTLLEYIETRENIQDEEETYNAELEEFESTKYELVETLQILVNQLSVE